MINPRTPCIIGTARHTWHPGGLEAPEPLAMWEQLAREVGRDASSHHDVLGAIDFLGLVHCQSWAYDRPADRLAQRLGITRAEQVESILAGTSPQRLLNQAATRMLQGETSVALIVGGEALATRRRFDRISELPPWSHPHPNPPAVPVDLNQWYLPTEIAHGVLPAWLTFALLEQARWAELGGPSGPRAELRSVIGHLSDIASSNPDAWFRQKFHVDELTTPATDNRMVATPYTKRMTAFLNVDMAAANLLVTKQVADAWNVPDDRRVYLRGWGFARDAIHVAARAHLDASPAMRTASTAALQNAGMNLDEIEAFDLYSCFGSAVQFSTDALGLSPQDLRPRSVTGGLPYHGGPSSNYMSHSVSHIVSQLREGTHHTALSTGIGMHMTKHVAAVWSRSPGEIGRPGLGNPQERHHPRGQDDRRVVDSFDGAAVLKAATVVHDTTGEPDHVIAICELPDGARCYARSTDDAVLSSVLEDHWVNQPVRIEPTSSRSNSIRFQRGTRTSKSAKPAGLSPYSGRR